jgi:peptidyl-prolyl cis-trans isomerase SurA
MSEFENKETETVSGEKEGEKTVSTKKKSNLKFYLGAFVLVVVVLLAVLYQLEKEGRSATNLFEGVLAAQEANAVVVTVNGTEIVNRELEVSIEQFTQMAASQGVDITNESIQSEIRSQAVEVLVNTELLKQEAANRGVSISDEEVATRLASITEEIGGEGALDERMTSLGIDAMQLQDDIREELLIQSLLNQVFADASIEVTGEEIAAVYEDAGGSDAGLPAIEEVSEQVEAQIIAAKEQEAIDALLVGLREGAEIQINE